MKRKNISKFAKRRRIALLGVIVFILIIIISTVLENSNKHKVPEKVSLLLNNQLTELKKDMYVDNDEIYMSKEDIVNLFDDTLYYNEAEKELITTYNTHIALLKVNEAFMVLNDSNVELKGCLTEKENTVYLPLSDMGIIYDVDVEYSSEYNRVILDSTKEEKKRSITLKKANVYEKASTFSKKIEKLNMSEYVMILGTEKNFKKVRTENGNIGYIKEKKISDAEMIREKMIEKKTEFNYLSNISEKNYNSAELSNDKQNIISPTYFTLDKEQKIIDKTNSKTDSFNKFTSWTNENNVQVWPIVTNLANVSENLLTYTQRNTVINNIYQYLMQYQFQGVCIKFEKIDDWNSFNRFLIELKPKLKESGLKLGIIYNSENIEKSKIENIADLLIEQ